MTKMLNVVFVFFSLCAVKNLYGDAISISASPATFTVNSAISAGQGLQPVTNTTTTYNVSTSTAQSKRITGRLSAAITPGSFKVQLTAPSGATSAGAITLSTTNQSLVTGIPGFANATALPINYTFTANINGTQVSNATVLFTITVTI